MGRWLMVALACVIAAACSGSGGSDGDVTAPGDETAVPAMPTITQTDVPAATPVPTPEVTEPSDEDKIAAAMAVLESEPLPAGLVAYDLIDARLRGTTGVVDIEVCGWTGDTVFDDIHQLAYRVHTGDDGTVSASLESANTTPGDCTNTTLIESALQATRDYDTYWSKVQADPSTFDPDDAAGIIWEQGIEQIAPTVAQRAADGLSFQHTYLDGALPESSEQEVLFRAFEVEGVEFLELIACRPVDQRFGLYLGGMLVDDFRDESSRGEQAVTTYQLVAEAGDLRIAGLDELVWADCFGFSDSWFDGINRTYSEPVQWERIP